jgi:hypothetical protein
MTLNVTERVSGSLSMLHPKCADMVQARVTKRSRLDSFVMIGSSRNRNHDSETMVWHANLLAALCTDYTNITMSK